MTEEKQDKKIFLQAVVSSLVPPFLFIVLLWTLEILERLHILPNLHRLGVYPRHIEGLPGLLTAPLVHGDFEHLIANSSPLFVLAAGILFFHRKWAWLIFLLITIGSGLFVWVFGNPSYHIGASGLLYGCASFLAVSGLINHNRAQVAISLLVFLFYGSMIWGILPGEKGISWEAHLGGLLVGIGCAFLFRQPPPPRQEDENDPIEQPKIGEYYNLPGQDD